MLAQSRLVSKAVNQGNRTFELGFRLQRAQAGHPYARHSRSGQRHILQPRPQCASVIRVYGCFIMKQYEIGFSPRTAAECHLVPSPMVVMRFRSIRNCLSSSCSPRSILREETPISSRTLHPAIQDFKLSSGVEDSWYRFLKQIPPHF